MTRNTSFANPGNSGSSCLGAASNGGDNSTFGGITYQYQYDSAGYTTGKRMAISRSDNGQTFGWYLDAYWSYGLEGKVSSVTYPLGADEIAGDLGNFATTQFTYTYDKKNRPIGMNYGDNPWAPFSPMTQGVQYNASDQITNIKYGTNPELINPLG